MTPPEFSTVACPFLGLQMDPQTRYSVPDDQHACHRGRTPQLINLEYQGRCCLAAVHRDCPGYQAGWKRGLPSGVRRKHIRRTSAGRAIFKILIALVALAALGGLVFQAQTVRPSPAATFVMITCTPTATPTSTSTPAAAIFSKNTPTPLISDSPTPGPLTETPFGPDNNWLVHKVAQGESLASIAQQYDTTYDVLLAINSFPSGGLWPDTSIIICQGCKSAVDLPRLQAVFIEERIKVDELAKKFSTDITEVKNWNGIMGNWVEGGRWVVVGEK